MTIDIEDEIVQDFLIESREILDALQQQLVSLEQRPGDMELLNAVFRGFHTIKGGAGFLSLEPLVDVCHLTEDLFNLLRTGEKSVTPELMDVVLQALDVVQLQFDDLDAERGLTPASPALLAALEALMHDAPVSAGQPAEASGGADDDEISDEEFEALLDAMEEAAAEEPEASAATAATATDEISDDEFEQLLDALHGPGQHLGRPEAGIAPDSAPGPASSPADSDVITDDEFESLLDSLHGPGKAPTAVPKVAAAVTKPATAKPAAGKQAPAREEPAQASPRDRAETTVRVDTAKLDEIMNMVGELVLVRNRLSTLRGLLDDERINQAVSDLELVTSDLQAAVMTTRMQPIKKVFGRFPRVVRDLARNLGKDVELELQGEETDLDKNLVEALADPLIHLVRNAVDHGIEEPADRQMAGKPQAGRVVLSASQEGDHILLTIADDGRGMDPDVLRRKAVEKGLLDAEAAARLEREDCFGLIFQPGFSTKAEVSDVSGRGVGLDVVKTRIAQLNGSIEIESTLGVGTTMKIRVPLTLAILPTLMVKIKGRKFALPMSVVREIFELQMSRTNVIDGRRTVVVRNKAMPLFFLERWLNGLGAAPARSRKNQDEPGDRQVITVVIGNTAVGFVVEEVLGLEEVVIKPLGAMLHGLPGLAGSTITGDGSIALIMDIPSLIKAFGAHL
jgi:two-component system chemotaxis sensor kinase CheA